VVRKKADDQERSKELRGKGNSYSEISKILHVSKSSAYVWSKGIMLGDEALKRIEKRKQVGKEMASKVRSDKAKVRFGNREKWAKEIVRSGLNLNKFTKVLICSVLYWGEGAKTSNRVEFTNSDPDMMRCFIVTLLDGFDLDKSQLRANLHLHEYHDEKKQLLFWSNVTGIPLKNFNKTYWKSNSGHNIRENYPGCMRVCFNSKDIVDKIKLVYRELLKSI